MVQLRKRRDWYAPYVPGDYGGYCQGMAAPGTWGDHVTLQAAADYYRLRIALVTSFRDATFVEIAPRLPPRSSRVLWLSFWAEVHYNSLYPAAEPPRAGGAQASPPPSPEPAKRPKLLGSRRLYGLLVG